MCGCSWKAGCRLPWAGHSGLTSGPAGVHARAPAVLGRETHPLQPPHTGILPAPGRGGLEVRGACNGSRCERSRPPLRAGLVWGKGGEGSPHPAPPLTAFLLVLAPRALLLEVTQLLRGDTQLPTQEMSGLAEIPGLQAGQLGPGTWSPEPRRWASHLCGGRAGIRQVGGGCASPHGGRGGAQQAHLGLVCSGQTG